MPAIRGIAWGDDGGVIVTASVGVVYTFGPADVPDGITTAQALEDYLNDVHIPAITQGTMNARAHVFSLSPFEFTLTIANNGVEIAADWWVDP